MLRCCIDFLKYFFAVLTTVILLLIAPSFIHPFTLFLLFFKIQLSYCQVALIHIPLYSSTPSAVPLIRLDAIGHLRITDFGLAKSGIKGLSFPFYYRVSKLNLCVGGTYCSLFLESFLFLIYYSITYIFQNTSYDELLKPTLAPNLCGTSFCQMIRSRCRGRDQNVLWNTGVSCT